MSENMPKTVKKDENPKISIDTNIVDMVQYDEDGKLLDFVGGDKFLELPDEVVKELSKMNRIRYAIARKEWEGEKAAGEEDRWKHQIEIVEQYASPRERMKVKGKDDNYAYYLASPARMHERAAMGYEVVPDGSKESVGLNGGNSLKTLGQEELVLMRTTKENKAKIDAAKKAKKEAMLGNFDAAAIDAANEGKIPIFGRENE